MKYEVVKVDVGVVIAKHQERVYAFFPLGLAIARRLNGNWQQYREGNDGVFEVMLEKDGINATYMRYGMLERAIKELADEETP